MPKQLINVVGVAVAVGILLLAIVLGVVPQLTAAGTTSAQADQVATTNAAYQARLTQLQEQKQNLPAIKATVAQLHRQIPAEYRLDDVFLLVAEAATSANATITSVTAGEPAAFAAPAAPVPAGQPTPAPGSTPAASASASPSASAAPAAGASSAPATDGRTQIDFAITVVVPDTAAASKFLDALRSGPRLLANVSSTATAGAAGGAASASGGGSAGVTIAVKALAFAQPSTTTVAKGGN